MSEHVLSILVKALGAKQASKDLKSVDSTLTNIGNRAKAGLGAAAGNLAKLGAVAGVGLFAAVKTGIDDLATLEDATTSVDGAIKQLGLTGKVTGAQVATWANEIEASIGAAFDDKAITQATTTLIRFGSVTPKNLKPAMTVMTDLAAKTGDVDSAATLLAKALADPTKAAGKLARAGVVLTTAQQDNIKALVKAGKTEQAQAVLLDLIAQKTKGAAAASQGPYRRALSVLSDVSEDARKALAEGFLPILERVSDFLSKKLADPKVISDIRGVGTSLASGFDKLIGIADKIPWDSVGEAFRLGGIGAKGILDAFVAMPPWVQTAVITGWGLNKLTGGAVTGIIGQLASGLIKGVLGMNAGVVNINAGVVNGAGGAAGAAGAAAGGAGLLGKVGSLLTKLGGLALAGGGSALLGAGVQQGGPVGAGMGALGGAGIIGGLAVAFGPGGAIVGSIAAVGQTLFQIRDQSSHQAADIATSVGSQLSGGAKLSDLRTSLAAVDTGINEIQANPLNVLVSGDALDTLHAQHNALQTEIANQVATEAAVNAASRQGQAQSADIRNAINNDRAATVVGLAGTAAAAASAGTRAAAASSQAGIVAKAGGLAAAAAIAAKDLSVALQAIIPITLNTRVSSQESSKVQATQKRAYSTLL